MIVTSKTNLPPSYVKDSFPNICQADEELPILKENPKTHCGPVAITNSLIYLVKNGFQMLIEPMGDLTTEEVLDRLINKLAKDMKTGTLSDPDPGTTPQNLMDGLEKYVVDRGYKLTDKSWRGWGQEKF